MENKPLKFRVVLLGNGEYKTTLARHATKEGAFTKLHKLKEANKAVMFPKRFVTTKKMTPIKYQIVVTKPTEEGDKFRTLRDKFGKTYKEKPLGDWTILGAVDYEVEEKFWIYGRDCKAQRPNVSEVIKLLMWHSYRKDTTKQIIVVHNKLVIHNEEQFDMVICKNKEDAQRLHHALFKATKKLKIRSALFMGTATPASIHNMYELIEEKTGWTKTKVRRCTNRH